jgi:hypothetical protein
VEEQENKELRNGPTQSVNKKSELKQKDWSIKEIKLKTD